MQRTWEVLVEAAALAGDEVEPTSSAFGVLNNLLGGAAGVTAAPGRYGAAVPVRAETADQARRLAKDAFERAAALAGLPPWPVVEVSLRVR